MSGRHQPLNGADSAQGLADAIAIVEAHGLEVIANDRRCVACSEPALIGDTVCRGHDRLATYTAHESAGGIAANE